MFKAVWAGCVLMMMALGSMVAAQERPQLDWLVGGWTLQDGERWSEEWWTPERGGLMLGASRAGTNGSLREFEHLRIVAGQDGRYEYQAQPGGRPTVSFREESRAAAEISFANPAYDYPQRVSYRRQGDTLTATISMMDGSKRVSWTFRRR